jgi:hypothetical protein
VVRGFIDDLAGTSNYAIHLNGYATSTGAFSWAATSTYTGSIPAFAKRTSGGLYLTTGLFGDVNGDGLPDYVAALSGQLATTTYLGNGSAWDATTTRFVAPKSLPTSVPTETASQLVDINGDGLDDWAYSSGIKIYFLLNIGTGWNTATDTRWTFATSTLWASTSTPTQYYDRGIRFMDLNGDGLPDLVRSYQNTGGCSGPERADIKAVYLNTGTGWATSTSYTLPAYITYCSGTSLKNNEFANFYGNGQFPQDILTRVGSTKGGIATVTYGSSISRTDNPGAGLNLIVARHITVRDGTGNIATTTYCYQRGTQYLEDGVRDRRFAGFSFVRATNPDSIVDTYYSRASIPLIGRAIRKEILDTNSNLKQSSIYRWDTVTHGNSKFVGLTSQFIEDFASDGSHRDTGTTFSYSSATDDLLSTIEYGEVSGNPDGTFSDASTDKRTTNISYAASSSVNMSVPIQKTVLNYYSATSSDQKFYYDSLTFGSVNSGNNTKQEDWISGTTYASSTKTYNSYGLVATSTDRVGNATSFVYDANNLYVATTTNPLLQQTQFINTYANGQVKWRSDPNSSLLRNLYDGLGRPTEVDVSSTSTRRRMRRQRRTRTPIAPLRRAL